MVDAPVSGSVITLQEGKLSVMVGGRKDTFDRISAALCTTLVRKSRMSATTGWRSS